MIGALLAGFLTAAAGSIHSENERLAARVAELTPRAAAIAADGSEADWGDWFRMRKGEGGIRSVAVAPSSTHLKVLVTLAEPLKGDAVWLALDAAKNQRFDGSLRVTGGKAQLRAFGHQGLTELPAAQVAVVDGVVEVVVRWADLAGAAPSGHALSDGPGNRVRVRASLWSDGERTDRGLAVASYLLSPRVRFDPEPPAADRAAVPATLPLRGTWYVVQGAMTDRSHANSWAYDLVIRDEAFHSRSPSAVGDAPQGGQTWGEPVLAPSRGTVRKAFGDFADRRLDDPGKGKEANRVQLDLDNGTRLTVLHLARGTVAVSPRERVRPGQLLGRVGNSGMTSGPHVHLVWGGRDGRQSPAEWHHVVVSLNLHPDDPWARSIDAWRPSAGFYVRSRVQLGTPGRSR